MIFYFGRGFACFFFPLLWVSYEKSILCDVVFIVSCPLGQELFDNKCQPCLEGYYRSEVTQPECVACPYKTSTYKTGSKINKCYSKSPIFPNIQQISVGKCQ